jgi:hypothetical protein
VYALLAGSWCEVVSLRGLGRDETKAMDRALLSVRMADNTYVALPTVSKGNRLRLHAANVHIIVHRLMNHLIVLLSGVIEHFFSSIQEYSFDRR